MTDRLVTSGPSDEDAQYEAGLRPRSLAEYIGQDRLRDNLHVAIAAARRAKRTHSIMCCYTARQDWKDDAAYVNRNEMGLSVRATAGTIIERTANLAGM